MIVHPTIGPLLRATLKDEPDRLLAAKEREDCIPIHSRLIQTQLKPGTRYRRKVRLGCLRLHPSDHPSRSFSGLSTPISVSSTD